MGASIVSIQLAIKHLPNLQPLLDEITDKISSFHIKLLKKNLDLAVWGHSPLLDAALNVIQCVVTRMKLASICRCLKVVSVVDFVEMSLHLHVRQLTSSGIPPKSC